jgi:TPR repeat protein
LVYGALGGLMASVHAGAIAQFGAPIEAPPARAAPIDPLSPSAPPSPELTRRTPPSPEAGPLRPADPARLARSGPTGPELPAAERSAAARELAQLRRAAEPRKGFGSTRAAADAAWVLGLLDLHGGVVPLAPSRAQTWFERATRYGRQPLAYAGLAWCAIDGCQGPPNPAVARQAIDKLRPRYPARALYLEWVLNMRLQPLSGPTQRDMPGVSSNTLPMAHLLHKAAADGDTQARVELGIDAVSRGDLKAARQYFQQAAPRSPAAAANLKLMEQRRTTPARDDSDAGQLVARARRLHRGDGVPANYAEALRLYREAAAKGSAEARRMVELIASRPLPDGSINIAWMMQLAQLDTSTSLPQLDTRQVTNLMQRDATPLYDLLPEAWRRRVSAARP